MTHTIFSVLGLALFITGLLAAVVHKHPIRRIIDINLCGIGVFMWLVILAYRDQQSLPDPLLHALVLTGIVVAISATALALAIKRKLEATDG